MFLIQSFIVPIIYFKLETNDKSLQLDKTILSEARFTSVNIRVNIIRKSWHL